MLISRQMLDRLGGTATPLCSLPCDDATVINDIPSAAFPPKDQIKQHTIVLKSSEIRTTSLQLAWEECDGSAAVMGYEQVRKALLRGKSQVSTCENELHCAVWASDAAATICTQWTVYMSEPGGLIRCMWDLNNLSAWPAFNSWMCRLICAQINSVYFTRLISWTSKRVQQVSFIICDCCCLWNSCVIKQMCE